MPVLKSSYFVRSTVTLVVCGGVAMAAVVTAAVFSAPKNYAVSEQPNVIGAPLDAIVEQLSLTERHMAVADLSLQTRFAVREALREHVEREWPALQLLLQARTTVSRRSPESPTGLATSRQAVNDWYLAARAAALTQVHGAQRDLLQRLHDNRGSALPLEFQVENYTQTEVVALRDALSENQRRAALGQALDNAGAELVSRRETAAVLAARQRLSVVP